MLPHLDIGITLPHLDIGITLPHLNISAASKILKNFLRLNQGNLELSHAAASSLDSGTFSSPPIANFPLLKERRGLEK
jgi:hypothetical protein